MSDFKGLTGIEVISGTAQDSPTEFRGFVTVRATAEDGSFLTGQLDPDELRVMAMHFLQAAEAAESDAVVMTLLVKEVELQTQAAAHVVMRMRDLRAERGESDPR